MIDLVVENGRVLVWNVEDVFKIRQDYRIVGHLIGSVVNLSYQEKHQGLPLALMKEEVNLLVDKGFARLVQIPALQQKPSHEAVERFKEHREQNYHKQVAAYREVREKQLRSMIDRIVEGKQNKRKQRMGITGSPIPKHVKKEKSKANEEEVMVLESGEEASSSLNPAALLKEEVEKIEPFPREHAHVTAYVVSPFIDAIPMADPPWDYPSNEKESLQYRVFCDLWERGHYITPGHNFGGDYLVYPGDPFLFHAQYIVRCVKHSEPISATDIVAFGRLSVAVRKKAVLASVKVVEDCKDGAAEVSYQSLSWSSKYVHPASKLPPFIQNRQMSSKADISSENSS
ncbi:tRNA-splicing endonuclease subunit Sen34 [Ischnura elegans]|uniref:tRNA-splicing endonuclease subunit Sen34 n=1 Tax=Ischnura elegans TaxID=197161 RepID=UPI001ED882A7|nr:tRNA-splicing endonuclease subunit Sen34 [Ischnura elegans]